MKVLIARDMCLRGINFASGIFLLANHSSEHVLHVVATLSMTLPEVAEKLSELCSRSLRNPSGQSRKTKRRLRKQPN